ncbi:MAG: hypothetical protein ABI193_08020 [Minicystis sp.]
MTDVSKMVADRVAISRTVLSSLDVHGSEVAQNLGELLFPKGAPKALTVEALIKALHEALSRSVTELSRADIAHAQELSDDEAPRLAREAAIVDVREQLISLRGTLSSVYGGEILKAYGLTGETPTDPELLLHRAEGVAAQLDERPLVEKAKQAGVTVDPRALSHALRAGTKKLKTALGDVRREEREAQLTLTRRNEAMATWNTHYQGVADTTTGIFELVGRGDLAERVRPTMRRRAGLTEDGDTGEGGAASPTEGEAPKGSPG